MRFAYYCVGGYTLAWQKRLVDEGHEVLVYHHVQEPRSHHVGRGIVPTTMSRAQWLEWGLRDPNTIFFFDLTSAGELADKLRDRGCLVVGGGKFMDRLEHERAFGEGIAERCGVKTPPTKAFSSVQESINYINATKTQQVGDGGWAWKPDRELGANASYVGSAEEVTRFLQRMILPRHGDRIKCIVQERVKGVALSTARWWNGKTFVGPYEGTIEHKKFMDHDVGPSTGCSFNVVWFYREEIPKIAYALAFNAIAKEFREKNAPPGLYDINCIVNNSGAWFLEWTPRLGIDSELTSQRGIAQLGAFLGALARGEAVDEFFNDDLAYMSVRLSVPPYPCEEKFLGEVRSPAIGVPLHGVDGLWSAHFVAAGIKCTEQGYEVADPFGFVGVALAAGTSLTAGFEKVYAYVKKLDIPGLQYRTDAAAVIGEDIKKMGQAGWGTTDILRID